MGLPDATSANGSLQRSAAAARRCGLGAVRRVVSTGSTNTDLVDEARSGATGAIVLVADHQSAGRGRMDRRWEDAPGRALLVSVRIPASAEQAPHLVRAWGAAARAAADHLVAATVAAKWPNDLVVLDGPAPGKLAGILAEFVAGRDPCVVIGFGCNIEPIDAPGGPTSLVQCGGPADRDTLLADTIDGFAARRADPAGVLAELRRHSATLGRRVRVTLPGDEHLVGTATALAEDGSLEVTDDTGAPHRVGTGDVVHLRMQ